MNRTSPAFVGFTVAGDPDPGASARIARQLVASGVDILELGMPFSDPIADGPTIQRADLRALSAGATPDTLFAIARDIRSFSDIPLIVLTHFNQVYVRGAATFYRDAHEAGIDGILIVDLPVEESDEIVEIAQASGICQIFLISSTTADDRLDTILARGSGFLYLVSSLGVTGVREEISGEALDLIRRVKARTDLPCAIGFGISKPDHVTSARSAGADAVIVGSAIVDIVERHRGDEGIMKRVLDSYISMMRGACGDDTRLPVGVDEG
jgi:tryptophan synthase alpha chain